MQGETNTSLQKLKKVLGYLKATTDYCMVLTPRRQERKMAKLRTHVDLGKLQRCRLVLESGWTGDQQAVAFIFFVDALSMEAAEQRSGEPFKLLERTEAEALF